MIIPESLRQEPYSMMLRKDDPQFKALVDKTIGGVMKSGEIDKIYAKWFTSPIPPKGSQHELPGDAGDQGSVREPERQGRLSQRADGVDRMRAQGPDGGCAASGPFLLGACDAAGTRSGAREGER